MKSLVGLAPIVLIIHFMLYIGLFSGAIAEETMTIPLLGGENNVYTTEFAHVPLTISGVRVDVSVKGNSYLKIWCELRIGDNIFQFTLNDMSLSYHLEHDRVEVDGKITQGGMASFKATIDTDGIIEGVPKLVLAYYSLNLKS